MKQIVTVAVFVLLSVSSKWALACSVIPSSFCYEAGLRSDDVILTGTIRAIDDNGIDIEVREVLRGVEDRSIIRIWDGTDFDCNGPFSMAAADIGNVGEEYVLLLPIIDSLQNSWDVMGDYRRPDWFGPTTALRVENDLISGFVTGIAGNPWPTEPITLEYSLFRESWLEGLQCAGLGVSTKDPETTRAVAVYNNPVYETLQLQFLSDYDPAAKVVEIYTATGQLYYASSTYANDIEINLETLPTGLFILLIKVDGVKPKAHKLLKT